MEKRTKIITGTIALLVVGLPLLFYVELAMGFSSSAGDYFKLTDVKINLIARQRPDSNAFVIFNKTFRIDTLNHSAIKCSFYSEYYSSKINSSSSLTAAREPGLKGSKEKIKSIACEITNLKDNKTRDISSYLFLPNDFTYEVSSEYSTIKTLKTCVDDKCYEGVIVFENLDSFQNMFNTDSHRLSHWGLTDSPILFAIKNKAYNDLDTTFKLTLTITLTDGSLLTSSTYATLK